MTSDIQNLLEKVDELLKVNQWWKILFLHNLAIKAVEPCKAAIDELKKLSEDL